MAVKIFQVPGLRIKSIQRAILSIASNQTTGTSTITAVDTTKSIVNQTGEQMAVGGNDLYAGYLTLTDATTVTGVRQQVNSATNIGFEVIEYY